MKRVRVCAETSPDEFDYGDGWRDPPESCDIAMAVGQAARWGNKSIRVETDNQYGLRIVIQ